MSQLQNPYLAPGMAEADNPYLAPGMAIPESSTHVDGRGEDNPYLAPGMAIQADPNPYLAPGMALNTSAPEVFVDRLFTTQRMGRRPGPQDYHAEDEARRAPDFDALDDLGKAAKINEVLTARQLKPFEVFDAPGVEAGIGTNARQGFANANLARSWVNGDVDGAVSAYLRMRSMPQSEGSRIFNDPATGLVEGAENLFLSKNPVANTYGLMRDTTLSSLAGLAWLGIEIVPASAVTGAGVGAVGGSVLPGAGTAAGAGFGAGLGTAAGFGLTSGMMEYANESFRKMEMDGVDVADPDAVQAYLADPEKLAGMRAMAYAKAIPVGLFDAFTAGVAGRVPGKSAAVKWAAEMALQAGGGAAGEYTGQVAQNLTQGKELGTALTDVDGKAIAMEAAAEIPTGIVEAGINRATSAAFDGKAANAGAAPAQTPTLTPGPVTYTDPAIERFARANKLPENVGLVEVPEPEDAAGVTAALVNLGKDSKKVKFVRRNDGQSLDRPATNINGTIYLDAGARKDGVPLRSLAAHEFTHDLEGRPEEFAAMADTLQKAAPNFWAEAGKSYLDSDPDLAAELTKPENERRLKAEHVAVMFESMAQSGHFWNTLAQTHPSMFQRVVNAWRRFVDLLTGDVAGSKAAFRRIEYAIQTAIEGAKQVEAGQFEIGGGARSMEQVVYGPGGKPVKAPTPSSAPAPTPAPAGNGQGMLDNSTAVPQSDTLQASDVAEMTLRDDGGWDVTYTDGTTATIPNPSAQADSGPGLEASDVAEMAPRADGGWDVTYTDGTTATIPNPSVGSNSSKVSNSSTAPITQANPNQPAAAAVTPVSGSQTSSPSNPPGKLEGSVSAPAKAAPEWTPPPKAQPEPVVRGGKLNLSAIERELMQWGEDNGQFQTATSIATESQDSEDAAVQAHQMGNTTTFKGKVPDDLRDALEGRRDLRMMVRSSPTGGNGADVLAQLGLDGYVKMLEAHQGQAQSRRLAQMIDAHTTDTPIDPRLTYLARIYKNAEVSGEYKKGQAAADLVDIDALPEGSTFRAQGEKFTVQVDGRGQKRIVSDETSMWAPMGEVPVDQGSVWTPRKPVAAADVDERQALASERWLEAQPAGAVEDDIPFAVDRSGKYPDQFEFMAAPDGSANFGYIPPQIAATLGASPGDIRLQKGFDNLGVPSDQDNGFGYRHLVRKHGNDIRALGFATMRDYIREAIRNVEIIQDQGGNRLLLRAGAALDDALVFELVKMPGESFYTIVTAFPKNTPRRRVQRGGTQQNNGGRAWVRSASQTSGSGSTGPVFDPLRPKTQGQAGIRSGANAQPPDPIKPAEGGPVKAKKKGTPPEPPEKGGGMQFALPRKRVDLSGYEEMNRRAQLEKEGRQTIGQPRLANIMESDEGRKSLNALDQLALDQGVPTKESFQQWDEEAARILSADYEGAKASLLNVADQGEGLSSAVATRAAMRVVREDGEDAIRTGDARAFAAATILKRAYREVRSEAGKTLAAGQDPFLTPAQRAKQFLIEAAMGISKYTEALLDKKNKERKAQLDAGNTVGAANTQKQIDKIWEAEAKKLRLFKEKLRRRQIDLDELMTWLDAPGAGGLELIDQIKKRLGMPAGRDGRVEGFFEGTKIPPWIAWHQLDIRQLEEMVRTQFGKAGGQTPVAGLDAWLSKVRLKFKAMEESLASDFAGTGGQPSLEHVQDWLAKVRLNLGEVQEMAKTEFGKAGGQPALEAVNKWLEGVKLRYAAIEEMAATPFGNASGQPSLEGVTDWVAKVRQKFSEIPDMPASEFATPGSATPRIEEVMAWIKDMRLKFGDIQEMAASESKQTSGRQLTLRSRADIAAAIREASAAKGTVWGKLQEYWINSILSGLKTHVVNAVGNAASGGWEFTVQRAAEAAINTFADRSGLRKEGRRVAGGALSQEDIKDLGARFGEFPHLAKALMPGIRRAARNFLESMQTNLPVLGEQIGVFDAKHEIGEHGAQIGGRAGEVIRSSGRMLQAADEFFKSLYATLDAQALAYRIARAEGLQGDAMAKRIAGLVDDITSPAWHAAFDKAVDLTFQSELGKTGKAIMQLRNSSRVLPFLLPFVKTPYNIFKTGLRKSPLGAANLLVGLTSEVWGRVHTGEWGTVYDRQTLTRDLAEQGLAWAAMLALSGAVGLGGDDDEPRITGTGEAGSDQAQRDLQQRTAPPMSIKIGGEWYSYARIEPMATGLATIVDALTSFKRAQRGDDAAAVGTGALKRLTGQFRDKTFLKGIGDVIRMFESPDNKVPTWANSFAVSWVPNIIRQPQEAAQGDVNERRAWGKGSEFTGRMIRRAGEGAFPAIWQGTPKVDIWGREIGKNGQDGAGTDFLYRALSPVDVRRTMDAKDPATRLDRLILNYQNQHPDQPFGGLVVPAPTFKVGGEGVTLSDAEYNQFLKLAGKKAVDMLSGQSLNVERPGEREKIIVERTLELARKWARMQVAREKKAG